MAVRLAQNLETLGMSYVCDIHGMHPGKCKEVVQCKTTQLCDKACH